MCVWPQGERGPPGADGYRGDKGEQGLKGEKVSPDPAPAGRCDTVGCLSV